MPKAPCDLAHMCASAPSTLPAVSKTKVAAEAWGAVLRTHAVLVPEMDRRMQQGAGIPLRWYDVLLELTAAPQERLLMGELADRVVLSRTRVSRVVDEMEAVGLIRREARETDRRSSYAVLTASGRSTFASSAPVYRAAISEAFASVLTQEELGVLRDLLGRVVRSASNVGTSGPARR